MEAVKEYFADFFATLFDEYRKKSDGTLKTLDEAADEIGISKGALSQYLNGVREPKISSLMKIAHYFIVSPNKLLGYEEEDNSDAKVAEIHVHTGLSSKAIAVLHKNKDDNLLMPVLNFLLEEYEDGLGLLDDIATYFASDLWDDMAEDERYNTLPGSALPRATDGGSDTSSDVERKEALLNILDELPEIRDAFHDNVICYNKKTKQRYIKEFAMRKLHFSTIIKILYPQTILTYLEAANLLRSTRVELTDEQIDAFEIQIRASVVKDHPEVESFQGVIPVTYCDLAEYDELTAVANNYVATQEEMSERRQQALSYLKEYREYYKDKKPSSH